jgi:hypothetical protein
MKKKNQLIVFCSLILSIFLACKSDIVKDKTSFTVTEESNGLYEINATFRDYKYERIQQAINQSVAPTTIFRTGYEDIDETITLTDKTQFYLKSSSGKLYIRFDKNENSSVSYQKIKEMAKAIEKALK